MDRTLIAGPGNDSRAAGRLSRRGFLRVGAATGLAAAAAYTVGLTGIAAGAQNNGLEKQMNERNIAMTSTNAVVLVHGAWADASSWSRVIPLLQQAGYRVSAVQLSVSSLADDIATTRRVLDAIPGPVTLVGHSYGGAVISGAGNAPNVKSLVYLAAFAPDEGETLGEVLMRFPPMESAKHLRPDAAGFLSVDPETFPQDFAGDVDLEQAMIMAVVQRPFNSAIFGEKAGPAAWRKVPMFFQMSENDATLPVAMERYYAERMKATTLSLKSSHASLVSHPADIAQLIVAATQVGVPA